MNAMTETARHRIERIRAEIRAGDYDRDGAKLRIAIDRLLAELLFAQPEVVEAECGSGIRVGRLTFRMLTENSTTDASQRRRIAGAAPR